MGEERDEIWREGQQEIIDRNEPIDHPRNRLNPSWPFRKFPKCLSAPPKPFGLSDNLFKPTEPNKFRELVIASKQQKREDEDE